MRIFRSSMSTLSPLSLDELRSPDFNLFFDQEYSEEEEAKAMAETMEQYMSKTQNGLRFEDREWTRPNIKEKWGYRATTLGFYQRNNANPSYQERRQSTEDTLRKFSGEESAKRHEENSNLIKEIRTSTDVSHMDPRKNQFKTLEIQIEQMCRWVNKGKGI
ncbi:hypothetical protein Tco_0821876 [Tanacetum coccineum]|uniref:Uncharacterized protein n=1 Tax=Tanacetum coccineum TaxID=301880 RepID=A0ABQ5AG46_9ASTR